MGELVDALREMDYPEAAEIIQKAMSVSSSQSDQEETKGKPLPLPCESTNTLCLSMQTATMFEPVC